MSMSNINVVLYKATRGLLETDIVILNGQVKVTRTTPNYHNTPTGGHEDLINLKCIDPIPTVVLQRHNDSNPRHSGHEIVTITPRLPRPTECLENWGGLYTISP
ncbi:hypothetical protein TNCV_1110551 [Trichonephila clavipes]|nr:hypothetical protein TNCV_1110551 [Trichonephila clavipes]